MKKDLLKLTLIGVTAGFCLSAKEAPASTSGKEIAMVKCSKDSGQMRNNGNGNGNGGSCGSGCSSPVEEEPEDNSCKSGCKDQGDQSDASSAMKNKRRSAAQKVVQGK